MLAGEKSTDVWASSRNGTHASSLGKKLIFVQIRFGISVETHLWGCCDHRVIGT